MSWLEDAEKRKFGAAYLGLTVLLTAAGFWIGGVAAGVILLFGCLAFLLLIRWQLRRRDEILRRFAMDLDRVLHGASDVQWEQYAEGELSVLQSEVRKLTLELRDRASALNREKAELADFMADISHQLRTPLTSANLILSMLGKPDLPPEQRLEKIRELQRMMQQMDWQINALLKMSRLDSKTANLQKERVWVEELVRRAAAPLTIPLELRELRLETQIPEDLFFIGDIAWTAEAVCNILKNCMEHTPAGGCITVEGKENPLFCQIRIQDNGTGIDLADLPHLFERFYRGKNAGSESIGIGLALARMICVDQNGTLKAENSPEGGACFTLRFYKSTI